MILGLNGKIGSGKTTVAFRLQQRFNFTCLTFSDVLKMEITRNFRSFLKAYLRSRDRKLAERDTAGGVSELIWDGLIHDALYVTRDEVIRAFLQNYGTDVRRADDEDWWVTQWEKAVTGPFADVHVVADGVRFTNEAVRLRSLSGYLIKVERPGLVTTAKGEATQHASEHGLVGWADWDAVLVNDGTVEDLWAKVDKLVADRWKLTPAREAVQA